MNLEFIRKLPIPMDIKAQFPLSNDSAKIKERRDKEIKAILSGDDNRSLLIVGPCSADRGDAVLEYLYKLRSVSEKVKDKIFILPRVYTIKPRSNSLGYMGMLHSPVPSEDEDILKGLISIRSLHINVIKETGFTCADEMLYPENHRYLSDILSYVTVGARSVENQFHRLTASGLDIPAGMKNPTGGNTSVLINSVSAAQNPHLFSYRNWEVKSHGNPFAHAILRGYTDKDGVSHPNYKYEDLSAFAELYLNSGLQNPAVIVDLNHANSGKDYLKQQDIAFDVLSSTEQNSDIKKLVKGFMLESYLVDGCQQPGGDVYGQSITDACLGFRKTEQFIYELAEKL